VESGSLLLPLESQIDTTGSNVTDSGEIGDHSITMLSTVNYRLNRLRTLIPDEAHDGPVIWTVARKLLDNLQRQNGMAVGDP
jgi:hypothetical protein